MASVRAESLARTLARQLRAVSVRAERALASAFQDSEILIPGESRDRMSELPHRASLVEVVQVSAEAASKALELPRKARAAVVELAEATLSII